MKIESGEWEGEYIDVNGYRGKLRIKLDGTGDAVRGKYELIIADVDEPQIFSGDIEGKVDGENVHIQMSSFGNVREKVHYTGQIRSAGSFARQALIGLVNPIPQINFGGGVWIVWRFGESPSMREG